MNTSTIFEEPILSYTSNASTDCSGCNLHCEPADIQIYANDLRQAKVGDAWAVEDFDKCPNSQQRWEVSYTVVYKENNGVAVLFRDENPDAPDIELIWIELASAKESCRRDNNGEQTYRQSQESSEISAANSTQLFSSQHIK